MEHIIHRGDNQLQVAVQVEVDQVGMVAQRLITLAALEQPAKDILADLESTITEHQQARTTEAEAEAAPEHKDIIDTLDIIKLEAAKASL